MKPRVPVEYEVERVAIVGSRGYSNLEAVRAYVRSLPKDTVVVSGGAAGVDITAEITAKDCGLAVVVWPADWARYGRRAGLLRNIQVVENCDRVVAFWDGKSRGTAHSIDLARKAGKPVEVVGSLGGR